MLIACLYLLELLPCIHLSLRSTSTYKKLYLSLLVPTRFFLQRFCPGARVLTDKETKAFMSIADDDSDGMIGADGEIIFIYLTYES